MPLTGLWEMEKMTMGDMEMTPVAKWTEIDQNGHFRSGNGWLQNATGTWSYQSSSSTFIPKTDNVREDPYGGFEVKFVDEDHMTWQREEEGMTATVYLKRIDQLPKGPADELVGRWQLQSESADVRYKELFIRWDRIFENRANEQKETGYWHIHGHRPEITFLSHNADQAAESWRISFDQEGQLQMKGISDSNREVELIFIRNT